MPTLPTFHKQQLKIRLGVVAVCCAPSQLIPHSFQFRQLLFLMEQSQDHPLQRQSDIYKRIRLLGSGSYGRAFLVREVATGEQWAIKQINLADLSPQEQADAMREAKILEILRHPNIVRFKEVYSTAKGKLNIVMEYAEGGDLAQRIKAAKKNGMQFSQEQVLSWFVQICLAVRHLHDSKVIHRDLKPQNIFLTADDLVKIGDFGVSRLMENTVARARTVVGSPYYLSPEIVENKPYSFKTDIWSLGTLLFEMCALQPPFSAGSLQALALKIVQGGYAQLPKQYSEGLRSLVKWMLQTRESYRPTIHQVLLSPVIASRIHRFLADSQLHRSQPTLKPPPNLIALEQGENKSEVVLSRRYEEKEDESPARAKAKTPQVGIRKGANNFFNRPPSSKRKIETTNDLADLIQIKPSLIEAHQKPERMVVPLPRVPKTSQIILPKPKSEPIKEKEKPLPMPLPSNSAFVKKRTSFTQVQGIKKEEVRSAVVVSGRKGQKKQKPTVEKPVGAQQKKKPAGTKPANPKPQIRKKISKPPSQTKLEVCSEQIKKKELAPKLEKKPEKKKEKLPKRPNTQQAPPKLQEAMQEEKCNSEQDLNSNPSNYFYDEDSFESYSASEEDIDLSLSDTTPNPYDGMIRELESIRAAIEEEPDTLPTAGQSIPQLLEFSTYPRVDDEELEQSPTQLQKQEQTQQIDNYPQGELESIRMNLEDIFGVENILYAYHKIEQKISQVGIALDEAQTIAEIIEGRPEIDEATLEAYFRLIVTIVGVQMRLL